MRMHVKAESQQRVLFYVYMIGGLVIDIFRVAGGLAEYDDFFLTYISLVFVGYILYRGPNVFFYDTDGEVMNLSNSDSFLGAINSKYRGRYEFPKYKFHSFRIHRLPFRRKISIRIKSKDGGLKKRTIYASYLTDEQFRGLKRSLTKYSSSRYNARGQH